MRTLTIRDDCEELASRHLAGCSYTLHMIAETESAKKVWTEAALEALPEDGYIHEVVNGELVLSPKNNFQHGNICARLFLALGNFADEHRLGMVVDSSTGFWMNNRNCRAPDISFVAKGRLKDFKPSTKMFFPGAPDLAVEVLSPNNTRSEIDARLKDFFASGAQIAWIINPDEEFIEVRHSPESRKLLSAGAFLEGEHVLPGFRYPIADLFKEWAWE